MGFSPSWPEATERKITFLKWRTQSLKSFILVEIHWVEYSIKVWFNWHGWREKRIYSATTTVEFDVINLNIAPGLLTQFQCPCKPLSHVCQMPWVSNTVCWDIFYPSNQICFIWGEWRGHFWKRLDSRTKPWPLLKVYGRPQVWWCQNCWTSTGAACNQKKVILVLIWKSVLRHCTS